MAVESSLPGNVVPWQLPRRELYGAAALLAGIAMTLFGLIWDTQWHGDVGPDTFFTAPHLLIYSGSAATGLASIAVVLRATWTSAAATPGAVSPGRVFTVLGRFRAPVGFLIAGLASSAFLAYGLWDLWWHEVYGFDAVPDSPPHVGLALSAMVSMLGTSVAFAVLRRNTAARWGLAASVAFTIGFSVFLVLSVPESSVLDTFTLALTFLDILLLTLVAGIVRRPGWVAATGLVFAAYHAASLPLAPWAARAYADAVGLQVRDYATGEAGFAGLFPQALLPVALLMEAGFWLARRRGWSPAWAVPAVAAIAGVVLAAAYPLQDRSPGGLLTVAVALPVAAIAGWLGWRVAAVVARLAPKEA